MRHPLVGIIIIYLLMVGTLAAKIGLKEAADYAWFLMIGACAFYWAVSTVCKPPTK